MSPSASVCGGYTKPCFILDFYLNVVWPSIWYVICHVLLDRVMAVRLNDVLPI
jgi:hypothetical protein